MAVIQVVVDDELLNRMKQELRGSSRVRSAFIREAIEYALDRNKTARLEEEQRQAYTAFPETECERRENDAWERAQPAGEPWDSPKS